VSSSSYVAIARKWRPQTFDEVVGQEHITRTLKNALQSGRIHHAFLFIGSRGIGKTTTARILAKALNCESSDKPTMNPCGTCGNCLSITQGTNIDVIEIDGASNNSVDDVRDIRETIRMVPSSSRYKIYIIDEVHQLSLPAFNALLKTLEEPPPHAIFVLATTEAHKIPATVISRCQRYDFRRVTIHNLVALLRTIVEKEGLAASDDALYAIARVAEGGVRDAESILDKLITYSETSITFEDVFDVLGLVPWKAFHDLCDAMLQGDIATQLEIVDDVAATGKDLSQFVEDLLRYYRNLLIYRTAGAREALLRLPEAEMEAIRIRSARFPVVKLIRLIEAFSDLCNNFDSQLAQRTALEAMLIRSTRVDVEVSLDTVMEKLVHLGAGGILPPEPGRREIPDSRPAEETAPVPAPAEKPSAPTERKMPRPPENPPEAGPPSGTSTVRQKEERITLGADTLESQWRQLVLDAGKTSLSLGLWLGRAHPLAILEDTGELELELEPGAVQAHAFFEDEENRKSLHAFLQGRTNNIRSVRFTLAAPTVPRISRKKKPAETMKTSTDNLEQDEKIAAVLHEFKGRIVRVIPGTEAGDAPSSQ